MIANIKKKKSGSHSSHLKFGRLRKLTCLRTVNLTIMTMLQTIVQLKINRVNIYESPILVCMASACTIYLLPDTGATVSIMTLDPEDGQPHKSFDIKDRPQSSSG